MTPVNPVIGQLMYTYDDNKLLVYNGVTWRQINEDIKYCVVCLCADWDHIAGYKDHPFCEDNLRYLEWKSEEAERV